MIQVTKDEAALLDKHGISFYKTCNLKRNGKKRGKYFVAETKETMKILNQYRKSEIVLYQYP